MQRNRWCAGWESNPGSHVVGEHFIQTTRIKPVSMGKQYSWAQLIGHAVQQSTMELMEGIASGSSWD